VQGRFFHPEFLLAGAGVGALVTAILVVNNLRDRETDRLARKRTLAAARPEGERGKRTLAVPAASSASDPAALIPALGMTAQVAGLYGLLMGAALALS
jgi:4-hydroxybenzoate polyprenyltransferase